MCFWLCTKVLNEEYEELCADVFQQDIKGTQQGSVHGFEHCSVGPDTVAVMAEKFIDLLKIIWFL